MKLRLSVRMGLDFWITMVTVLVVLLLAEGVIEHARRQTVLGRDVLRPNMTATTGLLISLDRMENIEFRYFVEPGSLARHEAQYDGEATRFESLLATMAPLIRSREEQSLFESVERSYRVFSVTDGRIRELLARGRIAEASRLNLTTSTTTASEIRAAVHGLRDRIFVEASQAEDLVVRRLRTAEVSLAAIGLLGFAVGFWQWRRTTRMLVEPLIALQGATHELASGRRRLAEHPQSPNTKELVDLEADFNHMAAQLHSSLQQLRTSNETLEQEVARRTRELLESNRALAGTVEQLQSLDRLKSNLLANMSHELLTPLNVIIGFGASLEEEAYGPLTRDQRQALEGLLGGAERLTRMVRNILDYSRLTTGELAILPMEIDNYAELVREAVGNALPKAQAKQQHLELTLPTGLPPVLADPGRVLQILDELLDNAIKYTGDGGTLTVAARPAADAVVTHVSDTGIGIAPEQIRQLSAAFYQADPSATRAQGGLGLGLAIVDHLIKRMGGRWRVTSQVGHGSTFTFELPRADLDTDREEPGSGTPQSRNSAP